MDTSICPHCGTNSGVRRWGRNRAGTQRYRCLACRRNFTPAPKEQGHGAAIHEQAVRLYLEGMSLRGIGRLLGVVHQSVANWVAAQRPPSRPFPPTIRRPMRKATEPWKWTNWRPSSGGKSLPISVTVAVARDTRLIVGERVMWAFDLAAMQPMADVLPAAGGTAPTARRSTRR